MLHLGGAFVDAKRADFAIQPLDGMSRHHAPAAKELHGVIDHALRCLRREHLGHRRLARHALGPVVARPRRAVHEQRARVDVGGHRGDLRLRELEVLEPLPEELARRDMRERFVQGAARHAECRRAHRGAEDVERAERDAQPLSRLAHGAARRYATILEANGRQRMRRDGRDPFRHRKPWVAGLDDQRNELPLRVAEAADDDVLVRDAAVRDPGLLAIDDVLVAIAARRRPHGRDVGSRVRFRDGECGDRVSCRHARQVAPLELGRSKERDCTGTEPLHGKREVGQPRCASQRLAGNAQRSDVQAVVQSAEFGGHGVSQPARSAELPHERAARGIHVRVLVRVRELAHRPCAQVSGERAVGVGEEGPGEGIGHG